MPWIYDGGNDEREAQLKNANTYNSEGIGKKGAPGLWDRSQLTILKCLDLSFGFSMSEIAELL